MSKDPLAFISRQLHVARGRYPGHVRTLKIEKYLQQVHTGARRRQAIFIASRVADTKLGDETTKATVKSKEIHISGFSGRNQVFLVNAHRRGGLPTLVTKRNSAWRCSVSKPSTTYKDTDEDL